MPQTEPLLTVPEFTDIKIEVALLKTNGCFKTLWETTHMSMVDAEVFSVHAPCSGPINVLLKQGNIYKFGIIQV